MTAGAEVGDKALGTQGVWQLWAGRESTQGGPNATVQHLLVHRVFGEQVD
jgi:hypothetical protein